MKRKLLVTLVVAVLAGGGALAAVTLWPDDSVAASPPILASRGDLVEAASASGTVEAVVQVEVKSRASGEVVEVAVQEGALVEAGQLLVRLDPVDAERSVRTAEVALERARADLSQAQASLAVSRAESAERASAAEVRARGASMGVVSAEEGRSAASGAEVARATVTLREAQVRSARTSVEEARLALEEAERRLLETTIVAPIAGTVLSIEVERGSIVSSGVTNIGGGTPVLTIADLGRLRVVGQLEEALVGGVEAGQDVVIRVDAYPRRELAGRVERVSPLGVTTSSVVTFDVEVSVADEDAPLLRPGMSADLEVVTERHEGAVLVPATALRGRGAGQHVVLASGERRPVRVGATDGVSVVVLEGLAEGEALEDARSSTGSEAPDRGGAKRSALPFGPPRGGRR